MGWGAGAAAGADAPPEWRFVDARLGFRDVFKMGCWTQLTVELAGGNQSWTGRIEASVADADGERVDYRTPVERPVGLTPGETTTASLIVRVGRRSSIVVRFVSADGKVRARQSWDFGYERGEGDLPYGQSGATRIMLAIGPHGLLDEIVRSEPQDDEQGTRVTALVDRADMPLSWEAYEGIDTVVVSASEATFFRGMDADSPRIAALRDWVRNGGRLVILGGDASEETLRSDGALASLLPGDFARIAPLRESTALETFSNSNESPTLGKFDVRVPLLESVQGEILAYAGSNPDDLPLVVQARQGVGLVTFCAIDPQSAPFNRWSGRQGMLRRLLGWPLVAANAATNQFSGQAYMDLSDRLCAALDAQFVGVKPASFGLVVLLTLAYIALIGPGDYLFVKQVLRRMEATWITFPLIVAFVSAGAYGLARWHKGDQLRVNQVEVVDVDLTEGVAYGTVWTHFFSPKVDRYNLSLEARMGASKANDARSVVAWMGSPEQGLGGMRGNGGGIFDHGYDCRPDRDGLAGLPVQEWSTKTLTGRWTGRVDRSIGGSLHEVRDDLLAGEIVNNLGVDLDDCVLMHGDWAYRLTKIPQGATHAIGDGDQPRKVKTLLTNAAAGDDLNVHTAEDGTVAVAQYGNDVARLIKTMMFFEAVGGSAYATALNRYHEFVDRSRLLNGNQAILLARAPADVGSTWLDDDRPLASPGDRRWVYYRFIIPLQPSPPAS